MILFLFSCGSGKFIAGRPTAKPDYILTWVVANEAGVIRYEIQDSTAGVWKTIDTVKQTGAGAYTYGLLSKNNYIRVRGVAVKDFYTITIPFIITNNATITNAIYKTTALNWTVSNELYVYYFLIEKSTDLKTWSKTTAIIDRGNGTYSYRLARTTKRYTYRISAVFKDGTKGTLVTFK